MRQVKNHFRHALPLTAAIERIRKIDAVDDLSSVIDRAREAFRLAHLTFLLARVGIREEATPPFVTTYPAGWTEIYVRRNYFEIDPIIEEARRSFFPFHWSLVGDRRVTIRKFFDEARSFGVGRYGLTVPIRAADGERSLLSVTSNLSMREWRRQCALCEDALFAFGRHFHERYVALSGLRSSNSPKALSRRERQCLTLLGEGLLFKQIAGDLQISESAVRQYVHSAKQKLLARTVSQAVARATALEIIDI